MDNLQKQIVENYEYIIDRLQHGYKVEIDSLFDQIIFENYKDKLKNIQFLDTQFTNLESEYELEYVI